MPKLYLTKQYYMRMPTKPIREPRERFVRYYKDLFEMEGIPEPETMSYQTTSQYSFAELGDALFTSYKTIFSDIDIFVAAYWSHEFDPENSFGAYFANQYGISSRMFDVCDQGILSPIIAINIIQSFVNAGKVNKAALFCFDQMAIPVEKDFDGVFPSENSSRILIFESRPAPNTLFIIEQAYLNPKHKQIKNTDECSTIYIKPDSPYYSCAELFTPILNLTGFEKMVNLVVMDSGSANQGILSIIPGIGLRNSKNVCN